MLRETELETAWNIFSWFSEQDLNSGSLDYHLTTPEMVSHLVFFRWHLSCIRVAFPTSLFPPRALNQIAPKWRLNVNNTRSSWFIKWGRGSLSLQDLNCKKHCSAWNHLWCFLSSNSLLSFRLSVIVYCLDNVHYQHTAQMVKALTEAEVKFRVQVTLNFPIAF